MPRLKNLAITYVFITNSGLNWSVYILEIVQNIDKLICNFRNIYGCLTLNKVHIKLTSLPLFSINDNLINTSTTSPLKGGEWGIVHYIAHLISFSTSTEAYGNTVTPMWKFLQALINVLGKWSI